MRIWRFLAAVPAMAIGLRLCIDAARADGSGLGLSQAWLSILAMHCFLVSSLILFKKDFFRSLRTAFEARKVEPRPLHPSEDTSELFY